MIKYLLLILVAASAAWAAENPDIQNSTDLASAHAQIARDFANAVQPEQLSESERVRILNEYSYLDPDHLVPAALLQTAVLYFDANKASFPNQNYITVVDFTPRSDHYRFFLIDMHDGSVERYHTTHGAGSDVDEDGVAESFGNVVDSAKSSLGFIRTAEVYEGHYKRSVRLDGLSETDSNIRDRAIVFHGWDHVHEADVLQGLTAGCITLDWSVKDAVLDKIKEGSLIYAGLSGATN